MARRVSKPAAPTSVEAVRHTGDSRVEHPHRRARVARRPESRGPQTLRYPRDPSLDPQLVWKGKDEQDGEDLEVPGRPDLHPGDRSTRWRSSRTCAPRAQGRQPEPQLDLFAPLQRPRRSRRRSTSTATPAKWSNRMILGDSLLVMTSLAEKEGLKGQVQTIYIDPPYGIKFGSQLAGQHAQARRHGRQGRGRHAPARAGHAPSATPGSSASTRTSRYLRDRLVVARELLTESGSIFVQIGDENVHLVRALLDEVFGSENFVSPDHVPKTTASSRRATSAAISDYLLWYARDAESTEVPAALSSDEARLATSASAYTLRRAAGRRRRRLHDADEARIERLLPAGARDLPHRRPDVAKGAPAARCRRSSSTAATFIPAASGTGRPTSWMARSSALRERV